MTDRSPREANRRYHLAFWPLMAIYVVFCFASPLVVEALGFSGPAAYAAAFAPALPIGAVIIVLGRFLRETDEYIRARQAEAMLVGWGATTFFTTGWGFLELYELAPDFPLFLVLPMFFFFYGLYSGFRSWRGA